MNIRRHIRTAFAIAAVGIMAGAVGAQGIQAQTPSRSKRPKRTKAKIIMTNKAAEIKPGDTITTMSGLRYIDYEAGTGKVVESGMKVRIDYAGFLTDGKLFDTSIEAVGKQHNFDRGGYPFEPLEFVVGTGRVIQGWEEGLTTNMKVGSRRRLIVPPNLGYGARGNGNVIPPNATMIFDVKILSAE